MNFAGCALESIIQIILVLLNDAKGECFLNKLKTIFIIILIYRLKIMAVLIIKNWKIDQNQ